MGRCFKTTDEYLKEFNSIHGNIYDYSLVDGVNSRKKIKIICKVHGVFEQRTDSHLMGAGCKRCNRKKYLDEKFKDKGKDFIKKSKKLHNNLYDYSKVEYITCDKKLLLYVKFTENSCKSLAII